MSAQGGVVGAARSDPEDEARIDELVSSGFVLVPELWHAEVANAFRSALRDDRIDETFVIGVCEQLDKLDIRTDVVGAQVRRLALSAHERKLTAYDTAYLLLAQDRGLPLATLDRSLAKAARAAQVKLIL